MIKAIINGINGIILEVLYRGFRVLYRHDSRVRKEIESWPQELSLKLVCGPAGAVLAMRKDQRTGVAKCPNVQRTSITMHFKSVTGALRVLTGLISVSEAYSRHLFALEGDIYQAMSFVRCVEYAEAYLFPRIWCGRILKEIPEKELSSLKVYLYALFT